MKEGYHLGQKDGSITFGKREVCPSLVSILFPSESKPTPSKTDMSGRLSDDMINLLEDDEATYLLFNGRD